MFFYVVSRTYAEIFSLLRICSGLLSNSPELNTNISLFRGSFCQCNTFNNSIIKLFIDR